MEYTIADAAKGLRAGQKLLWAIPVSWRSYFHPATVQSLTNISPNGGSNFATAESGQQMQQPKSREESALDQADLGSSNRATGCSSKDIKTLIIG